MRGCGRIVGVLGMIGALAAPTEGSAQHHGQLAAMSPTEPTARRAGELAKVVVQGDREALETFLAEHADPTQLEGLRADARSAGAALRGARVQGFLRGPHGEVLVRLSGADGGEELLAVRVEASPPHRILSMARARLARPGGP